MSPPATTCNAPATCPRPRSGDGNANGCHTPAMDLHFLGGATTVTGSQFLLETGRARVLIDCGMFQGSPNEAMRNRVPLAFDPANLDVMLLTHAHLDHCGLIPHLVKQGYRGRIIATAGTCELAELVLLDSGKLQQEFAKREARWEKKHPDKVAEDDRKEQDLYQAAVDLAEGRVEAPASNERTDDAPPPIAPEATSESATLASAAVSEEPAQEATTGAAVGAAVGATALKAIHDFEADLRAQPPEVMIDLDEPLYDARDAEAAIEHFDAIDYDEEREVAPGVHATYLDAGHILGSAIIRLRVEAAGPAGAGPERETTIVFSGDLGRPGTPIIRDPTILRDADYLLVESTYGGREHEPEQEAIRILAETVRMVSDAGGVLLVPSFAIGRTQEIVYALDRLLEQGKIPRAAAVPRLADGVEGLRHLPPPPEYFDEEAGRLLRSGDIAARLPEPDGHPRRPRVAADRPGAAAVHDRRVERDADRRPGPRPPPEPHRRFGRDAAVRRLPGRGHARRPPPGRGKGREARRPGARGPLPGPVDQRVLGPRRRARAARLARPLRRGQVGR